MEAPRTKAHISAAWKRWTQNQTSHTTAKEAIIYLHGELEVHGTLGKRIANRCDFHKEKRQKCPIDCQYRSWNSLFERP